jgi:hypothetical protein
VQNQNSNILPKFHMNLLTSMWNKIQMSYCKPTFVRVL